MNSGAPISGLDSGLSVPCRTACFRVLRHPVTVPAPTRRLIFVFLLYDLPDVGAAGTPPGQGGREEGSQSQERAGDGGVDGHLGSLELGRDACD